MDPLRKHTLTWPSQGRVGVNNMVTLEQNSESLSGNQHIPVMEIS